MTVVYSIREFLRPVRYGTVLLSEFNYWHLQGHRHKMSTMIKQGNHLFFNQPKQMIDQKNHMDPTTTVHPLPENKVDFELL